MSTVRNLGSFGVASAVVFAASWWIGGVFGPDPDTPSPPTSVGPHGPVSSSHARAAAPLPSWGQTPASSLHATSPATDSAVTVPVSPPSVHVGGAASPAPVGPPAASGGGTEPGTASADRVSDVTAVASTSVPEAARPGGPEGSMPSATVASGNGRGVGPLDSAGAPGLTARVIDKVGDTAVSRPGAGSPTAGHENPAPENTQTNPPSDSSAVARGRASTSSAKDKSER